VIRNVLTLVSLFNIGFGIWVLIEPRFVIDQLLYWQGSDPYGGNLTPGSFGEMRAMFGGLVLMFGVVTLRALWNPAYAAWLQPLAWCLLGSALARASSLILDGGSRYTFIAATLEATTALLLGVHSQRMLREAEQEYDEDDEEYDDEYEDEDEELT